VLVQVQQQTKVRPTIKTQKVQPLPPKPKKAPYNRYG
jgi:hypothetical protein